MSIILDTSFLAALHNNNDQFHKDATKLNKRLLSGEMGNCYINDYIFNEIVTLLRARKFPESQIELVGKSLLEDPIITIISTELNQVKEIWNIFKKYKGLSFTDSSLVVLGREFNIKKIATFDAGFNCVEALEIVK